MRILLVEDEVPLREPLQRQLAAGGHDVVGVGDCDAALEEFRIADGSPDEAGRFQAVVADLTLPGGDGLHLLRTLRELPGGDRATVILMVDLPSYQVEQAATRLGCCLLEKPIDGDDLLNRLGGMVEDALDMDESGDTCELLPDRGSAHDPMTKLKAENRRLREALEDLQARYVEVVNRNVNLRIENRIASADHKAASKPVPMRVPLAEVSGERPQFVGVTSQMRNVASQIRRHAAAAHRPVLIAGEPGSGRSLVARLIHEVSAACAGPLKVLRHDAAEWAIVRLRSVLFGIGDGKPKGGAVPRPGLVQQAHGGTLVICDAAWLPPAIQRELAVLMQHGKIQPIGDGPRELADPPRLIFTTGEWRYPKDKLVAQLRQQILEVVRIPPLRDRASDVLLLFDFRLRQIGSPKAELTQSAIAALTRYPWPGNVAELFHVADQIALVLGQDRLNVVPEATVQLAIENVLEEHDYRRQQERELADQQPGE